MSEHPTGRVSAAQDAPGATDGKEAEGAQVIPDWLEERVEIADCDKRVPCNVYSRIVGYITPVGQWNRGKQQEFADRQVYRVANYGERQC